MRRLVPSLLVAAALSVPAAGAQPACAPSATFDSLAVVTDARRHVDTLAAPSMQGRGLDGGHRRAAAYLVERFRALGLEPVGGGYTQPVPAPALAFPEAPELAVDGRPLVLGRGFLPSRASAAGAGEWPVVDVGTGVDLARYDLRDAVAVLRERVPDALAHDAGRSNEELALPARLEALRHAGARAAVIVAERLTYGSHAFEAGLPVFQVAADRWPHDAGRVRYEVRPERRQVTAFNVMGLAPGTGPSDSLLLVTAHYDHLGALGDGVYFPGANDNASGVAALLALAGHFRTHPPRLGVLFVAFSAEEVGLVGSRYFAARPPVDLARVRFVLNLDMAASGERGLMAVAGRDFPDAFARLAALNASLGAGPLAARANAPNSDHYFLLRRGAPGFYLYTRDGTQPYHHVDDVPATLDWSDWWHLARLARCFLTSF